MTWQFGRHKAIRTVLQNEANECGLACLAMVANYHDHDLSLPYLRSLFPLSQRGMTLAEVVELASQLDLDAQGLSVANSADLQKVACPALLHWNGNHFVVLEKVERGRYHVHDPAFGLRIYAQEDIDRLFSGVVLEFERRLNFAAIRTDQTSKFWKILRSCRGIENTIAIVAVLSLSANLFALATPVLLEVALDTVIPQYDLDLLTVIAIGMALFSVFDAFSRWLRDVVTLRSATLFEIFFTRNIVGHALRLPLKFFESRHPGDFMTRLTSVDYVKTFLISGFVSSVADGAMSIMMVILMFYYSELMAFASVSTLAVAVVLRLVTYPKIAQSTTAVLEARSEEQGRLIDGLKGIAALKSHNSADFFCLKWFDSFTRFANTSFRTKKLSIDTDLLLHIVFTGGTVATLYIGVTDVMKNTASVGVLYAFFALRNSFFTNMNALILNLLQLSIMRVHLERLDDVLDETPEPNLSRHAIDRAIRRTVSVRNVTIQFDQRSKPLLENVAFDIAIDRNEAIAIVGESGSGKSSLLKVLASLHVPSAGGVYVDGQPLATYGIHEFRSSIGCVFAEDRVFAGTVIDNLTMYAPDIGRDDIEQALRAVGLLEEIDNLPQGFATHLADESPILSTGQKKRLLLARALCRRPRLLLLDEATANLDAATEERICEALRRIQCAKIFVTHSDRVLRHVDRVFLAADGRLASDQRVKLSA